MTSSRLKIKPDSQRAANPTGPQTISTDGCPFRGQTGPLELALMQQDRAPGGLGQHHQGLSRP